jgi:hypothetical protein
MSKTGTTSIQAFLRGNAGPLANHGVAYPIVDSGQSFHPALAPSVLRRGGGPELNHVALAMEIRRRNGPPVVEGGLTPLWSSLFEGIDEGVAHTVIISYENFYIRPDLYNFDALASRLKHLDVCGIIYLRPQEDWLASLYGQMVRGRTRSKKTFSQFHTDQARYLTYSRMLDDILEHIPLDRLVVGDFEKATASGLLPDFIEKAGISHDVLLSANDQNPSNRSLPHWVTLFMLKCNQARISDETFIKVRRVLGSKKAAEAPRLRPGLDVATPEEREGINAAAVADADRLRERYGVTLSQRIREPIAYRPFDSEDVEMIRAALTAKIPRSALEALDAL